MDQQPSAEDRRERAEMDRVVGIAIGQLAERGIDVDRGEAPEDVEALLTAVQEFEQARARLGGDSFTNTLESTRPEHPALVLPRQEPGERLAVYAARVSQAARRLGARAD